MKPLRWNVTVDVPEVASAAAWPARVAAFALAAHAAAPLASAGDRIERTGAQGGDALAAFAAGRPLAGLARVRFVHHGALRVPASADAQVSQALRYLSRDGAMRSVIARVERAHTAYTLRIVHHDGDAYEDATRTIDWDPHSALRTSRADARARPSVSGTNSTTPPSRGICGAPANGRRSAATTPPRSGVSSAAPRRTPLARSARGRAPTTAAHATRSPRRPAPEASPGAGSLRTGEQTPVK